MHFTLFSSIVAALTILVPLVALHTHVLFVETMLLGGLLLAGYSGKRVVFTSIHRLSLIVIALLLWALVSNIWSIDPFQGFVRMARLMPLFVMGLLLMSVSSHTDVITHKLCGTALKIGLGLAALIFFSEQAWFSISKMLVGVTQVQQVEHDAEYKVFGTVIGALCVLLNAYYAQQKRWVWMVVFAAVLACIVLLSKSSSAAVALFLSLIVFVLFWGAPRITGIGMMIVIPVVFFLFPLVPFGNSGLEASMGPNALHRLAIWQFVAESVADALWIGHGLDSSRTIPGGDALVPDGFLGSAVRSLPQWEDLMERENAELLPLHPHNLALQVWLELGGVGVFLVSTFYVFLVRSICFGKNRPLIYRAGLMALLVYTLIIGFLSFGAWQSWWVACQIALWMVGVCLLRRRHPVPLPEEFVADRT
ncbi:O-antigen ligase family protein [Rhodospirillaceae bacterium KN72]|uniref:O-antigen ligase family protein n=1 Tax=Pacificispira spongiicola TaxID=2729598 RepID=A0A7Y0E3U5_9PROT|nr:O-antigen ligase family protein [Pacificispira spongiicola]NMM46735.1 O-antigen ligase family protein [Pacificispira spongiicola]